MNILVLGATGGTGRALVDQALELGHKVTAFARNPAKVHTRHQNLTVLKGDILNYDSVEAAIKGQDAVLSAVGIRMRAGFIVVIAGLCQLVAQLEGLTGSLGFFVRLVVPVLVLLISWRRTTTLSRGTKNIIEAMKTAGSRRFICESSLGIGDSKGQLGFIYNYILIPLLLRNIFADKELQEKIIKDSDLDWVIVRPAALTDDPRTRVYRSGPFDSSQRPIRGRISRADVADFMLQQMNSDSFVHRTPGISY